MFFTSIKKLGQLVRKKLMEDGLFGSLKPFGSQIKFFKLKKVQNEAIALSFTVALKSPIRIKLSFFRQLILKLISAHSGDSKYYFYEGFMYNKKSHFLFFNNNSRNKTSTLLETKWLLKISEIMLFFPHCYFDLV